MTWQTTDTLTAGEGRRAVFHMKGQDYIFGPIALDAGVAAWARDAFTHYHILPPLPSETSSAGFIPWTGGKRPVPPSTRVHVRFAHGGDSSPDRRADFWNWDADGPAAIIAYRVVPS